MKTLLLIIFIICVGFDIFMVTPFGVFWIMDNLDNNKPCYGIIIMFITAIPMMIIGEYLGLIK